MRILIASTQMPYNGGAATNAYYLIRFLRENGYKTAGLFIDTSGEPDPLKIGGVYTQDQIKNITNYLDGEPTLILAKNYMAPGICRDIFKKAHIIYLCSGSPHMKQMAKQKISAQKFLQTKIGKPDSSELISIKKCDEVLCNSKLLRDIFIKNYKDSSKALNIEIDTSSVTLNNLNVPQSSVEEKVYDICFCASDLRRTVKNFSLARKIITKLAVPSIAIGDGMIFGGDIVYTGKLDHSSVLNIISKSKVLLNTSYFDASPSVLREAVALNTNVLLSKNCGWSDSYPQESVCDDVYSLKNWTDKASYLINNKSSYNIQDHHKSNFLNLIESRR